MRDSEDWDPAAFAQLLKRVTDEGKIRAVYLASLAGISRPQIYRWMNGEGRPSYDSLVKLGDKLILVKPQLGIGRRELLEAAGYDVEGVPATEVGEADLSGLTTGELLNHIDAAVAELRSRTGG